MIFKKNAKAYHFRKVRRVKTPDGENCLTLKDWELKFEKWKFELKDVVDTYNKQKKEAMKLSLMLQAQQNTPKFLMKP